MPYKIAITGHFRTGKDTFADMLAETIPGPVVKLHFADALKCEVAEMVFNYVAHNEFLATVTGKYSQLQWEADLDQFEHDTRNDRAINGLAWQWWGEWRRQRTSINYWIDHPLFHNKYNRAMDTGASVIVSDMRHVNEAEWCRKEGFYLIRIVGPCRAEGERRDPSHASEVHVDELKVDLVLPNTGSLNTLKEITEGMPSHIALTHAPHYYLAKNNA